MRAAVGTCRWHKTPMLHRSLGSLLAIACWALAAPAARADTLSEAKVIRVARSRSPEAVVAREVAGVAEAELVRASLYPNPSVDWRREHVPGSGPGAEREDSVSLTVPVDITGRRPAQSALARAGVSSARARAALAQSEAVTISLYAFYSALAAEREVRIASRAVTRLDEATRVLGRRHEEGDTSGYQRARLEIEAELARSELRQVRAKAWSSRATLALLLGTAVTKLQLRGNLHTLDPGSGTPNPKRPRPSSALFVASAADAGEARSAADWAWVPTVALSGGVRVVHTDETRYGYTAGVALSLPVFSFGQELRAETAARQKLAMAEAALADRAATIKEARAREQLVTTRREVALFNKAMRTHIAVLERAAESGYREGDLSVVELVDAERARTAFELRQLELELRAKRAEIDLRAARGEFER